MIYVNIRASRRDSSSSYCGSGNLIKFTEKHCKNHETDNETHTYTPNIVVVEVVVEEEAVVVVLIFR